MPQDKKPKLLRILSRLAQEYERRNPAGTQPFPTLEQLEQTSADYSTLSTESESRQRDRTESSNSLEALLLALGQVSQELHSWRELAVGFQIAAEDSLDPYSETNLKRLKSWAEKFYTDPKYYAESAERYRTLWQESVPDLATVLQQRLSRTADEQAGWVYMHQQSSSNFAAATPVHSPGPGFATIPGILQRSHDTAADAARKAAKELRNAADRAQRLADGSVSYADIEANYNPIHQAINMWHTAVTYGREAEAARKLYHQATQPYSTNSTDTTEPDTQTPFENQEWDETLERLGQRGLKNRHWYGVSRRCPTYIDVRTMPGADPDHTVAAMVERLRRSGDVFVLRRAEIEQQAPTYSAWLEARDPAERELLAMTVQQQAGQLERQLIEESAQQAQHIVRVSHGRDLTVAPDARKFIQDKHPEMEVHGLAVVTHADAGYVRVLEGELQEQRLAQTSRSYTTKSQYKEMLDSYLDSVNAISPRTGSTEAASLSFAASGQATSFAEINTKKNLADDRFAHQVCTDIIYANKTKLRSLPSQYLGQMRHAIRTVANRILSDVHYAPQEVAVRETLNRLGNVFVSAPSTGSPDGIPPGRGLRRKERPHPPSPTSGSVSSSPSTGQRSASPAR